MCLEPPASVWRENLLHALHVCICMYMCVNVCHVYMYMCMWYWSYNGNGTKIEKVTAWFILKGIYYNITNKYSWTYADLKTNPDPSNLCSITSTTDLPSLGCGLLHAIPLYLSIYNKEQVYYVVVSNFFLGQIFKNGLIFIFLCLRIRYKTKKNKDQTSFINLKLRKNLNYNICIKNQHKRTYDFQCQAEKFQVSI